MTKDELLSKYPFVKNLENNDLYKLAVFLLLGTTELFLKDKPGYGQLYNFIMDIKEFL